MDLCPTAPYANISFEDHINRGEYWRSIGSQYISTSRNPEVLLRWLYREGRNNHNGTLAIIDLRLLDPRIELYEMSKMLAYLTDKPYTWATRHEEVLVHPYINRNAIVEHFTYSALWRRSGDWFRFRYNGLRWIDSIRSGSPRCYFCMEPGHTDSHCIWLDDKIHSYYSIYCSFCQEHGHDDSECNVDDYCNWCEEYGHDDSNCSEMDDWFASENSLEQCNNLVRRFN
ncbi:hypothetical protein BGX24_012351 [Mortierella sp. AD032]|nr:hypothetical protein BGX24_012351 [Mortierella sp. AD032]